MSMLKAFFTREKKSYSLLNLPLRVGAGLAPYPSVDNASLQQMAQRNEVAFACIRLLSKSANDPRLVVQTRTSTKDEWQDQTDHPLTRLMMRPKKGMDGAEFLRASIASWETTRLFVAEKVLNNLKQVSELHPIDPTLITPKYNTNKTEILLWQYRNGGVSHDYKPEELLIRRTCNWYDPKPLAVAAGSVKLDTDQTSFISSFFEAGGTPPGVIKVKRKLRDGQAEQMQEAWKAKYGSTGRYRGAPAVFDEDGDYQKIGSSINELDSGSLRGFAETRIAMVWGIHPTILGTLIGLEHSTYSNYKEAQEALWDQVLTPMYKEMLSWLTWNLLVEFEPEDRIYAGLVRLHWDMSSVEALQDNVVERDKRAVANYRGGIWKRNEARALTGKDPDPDGDVYVQQRGQQNEQITQQNN